VQTVSTSDEKAIIDDPALYLLVGSGDYFVRLFLVAKPGEQDW
jgi:hypothetical protein